MQSAFEEWETRLQSTNDIGERINYCYGFAMQIGFDALFYDFSPISQTPEGGILIPNIVQTRNMPKDLPDLWCGQGYYHHDPVHRVALGTCKPFFWSYRQDELSAILHLLDSNAAKVTDIMRAWRISRGVTVPLHMPGNRFATLTGFWYDETFGRSDATSNSRMATFTALAHVLQDNLSPLFGTREMTPGGMVLTARERECIALAAQGLPAKQMAWKLSRSESTVVMHLKSAMRKLGARNRVQAVARAVHYGYLAD